MAVLVDTSVWVAHFKRQLGDLQRLLIQASVMTHSLVLGEIACGTQPHRQVTLQDLADLPDVVQATLAETLALIERHRLYGWGCGIADMMLLLAPALMTSGTKLGTLDKRLAPLAHELGVLHRTALH